MVQPGCLELDTHSDGVSAGAELFVKYLDYHSSFEAIWFNQMFS